MLTLYMMGRKLLRMAWPPCGSRLFSSRLDRNLKERFRRSKERALREMRGRGKG